MPDGTPSEADVPRFPIWEIETVREGANEDAEELFFAGGACGSCGTAAVVGFRLFLGLLFEMCACVWKLRVQVKRGRELWKIASLRGG